MNKTKKFTLKIYQKGSNIIVKEFNNLTSDQADVLFTSLIDGGYYQIYDFKIKEEN